MRSIVETFDGLKFNVSPAALEFLQWMMGDGRDGVGPRDIFRAISAHTHFVNPLHQFMHVDVYSPPSLHSIHPFIGSFPTRCKRMVDFVTLGRIALIKFNVFHGERKTVSLPLGSTTFGSLKSLNVFEIPEVL